MAKSSKLRIMISSRCDDPFPAGKNSAHLSVIRREMKTEIEAAEVFGKKMFEVWINEETPPQGGTWDSSDVCRRAAKECDVLIAVCNGNAGWAAAQSDIGICHAELMKALSIAPAKVRLVALDNIATTNNAEGVRNKRFQEYVAKQNLFRGGTVRTSNELKNRVKEALYDALLCLAQSGVRDASRGAYDRGDALDWSRLSYEKRQSAMCAVLKSTIVERTESSEAGENVFIRVKGRDILVVPHAIPAAFSVAPARESVGQPFLKDHLSSKVLTGNRSGPVHVIGCHKTITESQATKFLGFSDATVVTTSFGVFVADNIQKIQCVFINNCRDESNTRHGVQRFFEWLTQTREDIMLADRAVARSNIVRVIAQEAK